jgi:hypothetical protein
MCIGGAIFAIVIASRSASAVGLVGVASAIAALGSRLAKLSIQPTPAASIQAVLRGVGLFCRRA